MPENDDFADDDQNPEETRADRNWKALREKAGRADDLERQLADLQRKDAFRDAGLDLTNRQHAYFMRGYDGPLEADKIRNEATDAGFLGTQPSPEGPAVSPTQAAGMERIGNASDGGTPIPPKDAAGDLDDIYNKARAERWTTDRLNDEIANWARENGVPVAYDGV